MSSYKKKKSVVIRARNREVRNKLAKRQITTLENRRHRFSIVTRERDL